MNISKRTPRDLETDIDRAVKILELFTDPNQSQDVRKMIPADVLRNAHGILFVRLYKVAFLVSGKYGTGVIIARRPDGTWSAPSGVSISSVGYGTQAGGQVIDSIIVMNYRGAVKAFLDGGGQLQLGLGVSLAAGPVGRSAEIAASTANGNHVAATYAYSVSKGIYGGYSFEGSKLSERVNTNQAFYGRPITAAEILTGAVPTPHSAERLYQMLHNMGAGYQPGEHFAPKKPILPPRPQNARDGQRKQSFEELPPPPYQESDMNGKNRMQYQSNPSVSSPSHQYSAYDKPSSSATDNNGYLITSGNEYGSSPSNGQASTSNNIYGSSPNNGFASTSHNGHGPLPNNRYGSSPNNGYASSPNNVYGSTSNNIYGSSPNNGYASTSNHNGSPPHHASTSANGHPFTSTNTGQYNSSYFNQNPQHNVNPVNNHNYSFNTPNINNSAYHQQMGKPSSPPVIGSLVKANQDYHSMQPGHLSFSAGDHIIVTHRLDDREANWEGEIGDRKGLFPANLTTDVTD